MRLIRKAGLGVVAAGALAGAAVFLAGSGGDAAMPTTPQQAAHGSKVDLDNPDPNFKEFFATREECAKREDEVATRYQVIADCSEKNEVPGKPFTLTIASAPNTHVEPEDPGVELTPGP